ncbi:acetoacetate-CoA ligase [Panus rudis PR-1116 ss-1]|nr:acetoacetate-CoA ligase [Panus rudis PR-1116 ss-1]
MEAQFSQSRLIWKPKDPARTCIDAFRRQVNRTRGLHLRDFFDLHKYSVEDYRFWEDVWAYSGIIYSRPYEKVIAEGRIPEVPEWFIGSRLNYAENLLKHDGDAVACTVIRETGITTHYTWRQLRNLVRHYAAALRVNGLQVGDRVAAIVTNSIEAIVIALAVSSIGGIFSSTAPDMGVQGILDRYKQIQPKFVFSETEVVYASKTVNLIPKISQVAKELSSFGLERVILLPSTKTGMDASTSGIPRSVPLAEFLRSDDGRPLVYEQLPFGHPLYILYSSGTSGPPKCITHCAGGILLQGVKDSGITHGMTKNDTYFQYTTTGWMMWNSMVTTLACGNRLVLYDGSPFHPDISKFLKMVSDQGVTLFGTGPRFLSEVKGRGLRPLELAPFDNLRAIISTGAILTAPMFEWTQEAFGPDVAVVSVSGGTDICQAFVGGVPTLPVHAGEIQGKSLGMKVEIFDPSGRNIEDSGEPGELVCTRPHPSLPIYFWGDEGDKKLRSSYFETYPGIWRQGDFIVKNPKTQGFLILGRSDGVLNPSGVRMGSGEIYSVMEQFSEEIDDCLCVGQRRPEDKDERILLFVKMRPNRPFSQDLDKRIRQAIRKNLSARHVPSFIFPIEDIPYTVNNKKIEIAVKQIVSGSNLKPSGTVANPEALELYYKFRHLEDLLSKDKAKL